jgi:hypothetical protein
MTESPRSKVAIANPDFRIKPQRGYAFTGLISINYRVAKLDQHKMR